MQSRDAMLLLASARCEVCAGKATILVNDFRELPPATDAEGDHWSRREVAGTHFYCAAHDRASVTLSAERG